MHHGDPFSTENENRLENECLPAAFCSALSNSEEQYRELDWVLGDFSYSSGYNEHSVSGSAFDVYFNANGIPGASQSVDDSMHPLAPASTA